MTKLSKAQARKRLAEASQKVKRVLLWGGAMTTKDHNELWGIVSKLEK